MKFTRTNRSLLTVGALASLLCFLFPPWVVNGTQFLGHHYIFTEVFGNIAQIDMRRLLAYQGIIASATFWLMALFTRPVPVERPDAY